MEAKVAPEYEMYMSIIDRVTTETSDYLEDDEDEDVDLSVLQALKELWKEKLIGTKVVEPDRLSTFSGQPLIHHPPFHAKQANLISNMSKPEPASTISALMNVRLPKPQPTTNQPKASSLPRQEAPMAFNPNSLQLLTMIRADKPASMSQPKAFIQAVPVRNTVVKPPINQQPLLTPPKPQPYRFPAIQPIAFTGLIPSSNPLNHQIRAPIPAQRPVQMANRGTLPNGPLNLAIRPSNMRQAVPAPRPSGFINQAPVAQVQRQPESQKIPIANPIFNKINIRHPTADFKRLQLNIRQLDGPADVELMDDFFDDDDDDEEETFNDNDEGRVADDNEDDDADDGDDSEVHDIDGETPPTMDDIDELFDCDDVVTCSYDNISSKKGRFRISLAAGIISCQGKECVFSHAKGETELCALKKK